jgi:hypothetical protein
MQCFNFSYDKFCSLKNLTLSWEIFVNFLTRVNSTNYFDKFLGEKKNH